jgi:hypothetical protein
MNKQIKYPTPWTFHIGCDYTTFYDTNGEIIGTFTHAMEEAEAERIICAVNCHDKLVEACNKFLDTWRRAGPLGSGQFEKFDVVVRLAEQAVEKIKGESA